MGSPQDPSAPPAPQAVGDGKDWQSQGAAIDTPGLAVPVTPTGPPSPELAMGPPTNIPVDAVPAAAARPEPEQGVPTGLAAPVAVPQQTPGQQPYAMPAYGGGPVGEIQARAKRDAEENRGLRTEFDRAAQVQKDAQNALSDVQRNMASDLGENLRHQQTELAKVDEAGKKSQLAHDQTIQQRSQQLDDAVAAQKNMVFDPDKYVNSLNFGQKLFTAIAVGLSAMGSSRSIGGSGENIALGMLKQSIQNGVDQQKEAYRRAGVNIDMANNAYARARQSGMDDRDATAAARLATINEHKMAAEVITARYEPDKVDAQRKVLLANLDVEANRTHSEFAQRSQVAAAAAARDSLQASSTVFNMGVQAENLRLNEQQADWAHQDRQSALAEKAFAAQQKAKGKGPGGIADWEGNGATLEQQNKAAGVKGAYDAIAPLMQKAMDFRKEHAHGTISQAATGQAQALHESTLLEVKNLAQLGVLSDSDIELVNKLIGPSADSFGSDDKYNARMTEAMDYVKKKAYAQMRGFGYTPTSQSDPLTRKADPMTADTGFKETEGGR